MLFSPPLYHICVAGTLKQSDLQWEAHECIWMGFLIFILNIIRTSCQQLHIWFHFWQKWQWGNQCLVPLGWKSFLKKAIFNFEGGKHSSRAGLPWQLYWIMLKVCLQRLGATEIWAHALMFRLFDFDLAEVNSYFGKSKMRQAWSEENLCQISSLGSPELSLDTRITFVSGKKINTQGIKCFFAYCSARSGLFI